MKGTPRPPQPQAAGSLGPANLPLAPCSTPSGTERSVLPTCPPENVSSALVLVRPGHPHAQRAGQDGEDGPPAFITPHRLWLKHLGSEHSWPAPSPLLSVQHFWKLHKLLQSPPVSRLLLLVLAFQRSFINSVWCLSSQYQK